MKRIHLTLLLLIGAFTVSAQDHVPDSLDIDEVISACVDLRDAAAANDTTAIRTSSNALKSLSTINFGGLRCLDDSIASLNGHLVFDEFFADSLLKDTSAYQRADEILRKSEELRGQNPDGSISTKTCFVKAGGCTTHTFRAKGHQELAVVAESGGLVTMKIHVTNNAGLDERHDDTKDVRSGRPQRRTSFELPSNVSNFVELKVFNCGTNDISFVVISN